MGEYSEAFVAFDVSKTKHAVAIAAGGRGSEVRFLGEVSNSPDAVERLICKLAGRYGKLHFCYEGPTGYGLHRQIQALGHVCLVVAPALLRAVCASFASASGSPLSIRRYRAPRRSAPTPRRSGSVSASGRFTS